MAHSVPMTRPHLTTNRARRAGRTATVPGRTAALQPACNWWSLGYPEANDSRRPSRLRYRLAN